MKVDNGEESRDDHLSNQMRLVSFFHVSLKSVFILPSTLSKYFYSFATSGFVQKLIYFNPSLGD